MTLTYVSGNLGNYFKALQYGPWQEKPTNQGAYPALAFTNLHHPGKQASGTVTEIWNGHIQHNSCLPSSFSKYLQIHVVCQALQSTLRRQGERALQSSALADSLCVW